MYIMRIQLQGRNDMVNRYVTLEKLLEDYHTWRCAGVHKSRFFISSLQ